MCEEVRGDLCLLASSSLGRPLLVSLLLSWCDLSCDSRRRRSLPLLVELFLRGAMTPGMNPVTTGRGGSVVWKTIYFYYMRMDTPKSGPDDEERHEKS